jgi:hypothetical protein
MDVGLVIIDTYPSRGFIRWVYTECIARFSFNDVYLFSDENFLSARNWYRIPKISTVADYSDIVIRVLPHVIQNDHVIISQWDGFIIDESKWTDEFLDFDYIGAVWEGHSGGFNVGNGGFSLRSKRLFELIRKNLAHFVINSDLTIAEDENICKINRSLLEFLGIKFAPPTLARQFSYEGRVFLPSFGFHGPKNVARFTPEHVLLNHQEDIISRISHPAELLNFLLNLKVTNKFEALGNYIKSINNDRQRLLSLQPSLNNFELHNALNEL